MRQLRGYGGDIWNWWRDFTSRTPFTREEDHTLLMLLGVSACFSANPDGGVELPFDPHTGVLRPPVWQRWLDWDPVRMVPRYAAQLRGLRAIWIDAGTRDEYHLDLGATAFETVYSMIGRGSEPGGSARGHDIALPTTLIRRESCGCDADSLAAQNPGEAG